jgi:hypothetical protein
MRFQPATSADELPRWGMALSSARGSRWYQATIKHGPDRANCWGPRTTDPAAKRFRSNPKIRKETSRAKATQPRSARLVAELGVSRCETMAEQTRRFAARLPIDAQVCKRLRNLKREVQVPHRFELTRNQA